MLCNALSSSSQETGTGARMGREERALQLSGEPVAASEKLFCSREICALLPSNLSNFHLFLNCKLYCIHFQGKGLCLQLLCCETPKTSRLKMLLWGKKEKKKDERKKRGVSNTCICGIRCLNEEQLMLAHAGGSQMRSATSFNNLLRLCNRAGGAVVSLQRAH